MADRRPIVLVGNLQSEMPESDALLANAVTIEATSSAATLGDELVSNGTFTGNADGWTLGTNWAYGTNNVVLTFDGATEGTLSQTLSGIASGGLYLVSWTQTHSAANNGTIQVSLGGVTGGNAVSGNSTGALSRSEIIAANTSGSVALTFTPAQSSGGTGTVTLDTVSVKLIAPVVPAVYLLDSGGTTQNEIRVSNSIGNTNIGFSSGEANTTGQQVTAIGYQAAQKNTTGILNTAIGAIALRENNAGGFNIAVGGSALRNCKASSNVAVGAQALNDTTIGAENSAIGRSALFSCTNGNLNVGIGRQAGFTDIGANALTTASYCTFIGAQSGFGSTTQYDYATAIGYQAKVTSANTVVLGRTTDTTVIGATGADGSNALLQVTGSSKITGQYINASTKTLTESSATGIVDIAVAAGTVATGEMTYAVEANDGTDYQTLRGRARYAVVNKGGTLTVNLIVIQDSLAVSAGTLTATCTSTSGTNKITLSINAVSSLTQTTLRALWRIEHEGGVITAL